MLQSFRGTFNFCKWLCTTGVWASCHQAWGQKKIDKGLEYIEITIIKYYPLNETFQWYIIIQQSITITQADELMVRLLKAFTLDD